MSIVVKCPECGSKDLVHTWIYPKTEIAYEIGDGAAWFCEKCNKYFKGSGQR